MLSEGDRLRFHAGNSESWVRDPLARPDETPGPYIDSQISGHKTKQHKHYLSSSVDPTPGGTSLSEKKRLGEYACQKCKFPHIHRTQTENSHLSLARTELGLT